MTANRPADDPEAAVGLCGRCRFARTQAGSGGSRFWRCKRSDEDLDYPRYPRIPVITCPGFAEDAPAD